MERIICLCIGYVCGLLQTGYLVGKINHIDIRKEGSGNAGSTNAVRVMGWKAGLLTFAGDVVKCVAAIFIVRYIYRGSEYLPLLAMYAGLGATLGHNFPFYLRFKGGKGIAVLAGLVVSTDPLLVPIPLAGFLIAAVFTRYVSLGSLLASSLFFLEILLFGHLGEFHMAAPYTYELYILVLLLTILAWYRHKANIGRLLSGTENRFGSGKKKEAK
ncbi:glycerol-3-phosphate 1-O-acyltransferase PlsY [Muricomes sp. OA1]|uniref:Glycerol-3-phosphate acyltransferase n=1 Tax=Hungatella hathewayi TaxID=154046 RepID=A0A3E2X0B7_9FIRM|nr:MULTISPECIES: glycerol-3-phosphate 1-O-acyltransferase PlsY [Clostridia]MEE0199048.1 glycerol-3-phosphate 1-O-acyltransferase PlsY [Muricomes sp.]MCH1973875.1 glycerol-3-phosphate 1-O-acyltransferase PlsY [Muricomes sp. OA1]MRM87570.1 glycerol-3-phosphate 1-O-acyltransferase [Faecalicatena contorta]RGC34525.1 glycerol-3-phosphate 1-O-acyltransferase [Hungatella hathewayi]GKH32642.1 glycerol-3-phosphate acyltransferase [Faecalicatena contorta]